MLFGNKIRALRDEQGVLQRQLAAYLEIDTPMFSKIERGDRRAKRSQVIMLAEYFHVDEKEMLTLWLADKILDALEGEEELGLCAIEPQNQRWRIPSLRNRDKKLSTLCPHTCKMLAFYFAVSCICTNFAIGNRLK